MIWVLKNNDNKTVFLTPDGKVWDNLFDATKNVKVNKDMFDNDEFKKLVDRSLKINKIIKTIP